MLFIRNLRKIKKYLVSKLKYRENPYRVLHIPTKEIKYVTPASEITDISQHKGDLNHPHAYLNTGYFKEVIRIGSVIGGDWDYPRIEFTELLEYKSLKEAIVNELDWCKTDFSKREVNYIKSGKTTKKFSDVNDYLANRKQEVVELINSIRTNGVRRVSRNMFSDNFIDEISVNVASDGEILFNNRGHHRLAIAKILEIKIVPVAVIVWHLKWVRENGFVLKHEME